MKPGAPGEPGQSEAAENFGCNDESSSKELVGKQEPKSKSQMGSTARSSNGDQPFRGINSGKAGVRIPIRCRHRI